MELEQTTSVRVIDHRRALTHGLPPVLALLLGWVFWHSPATTGSAQDPAREIVLNVSTALDRGDDYWADHLDPSTWRMPHVVLIDHEHGEVTPCGHADADSGPFYCPANERIYVDVDFVAAISGDLARAYVTAHELGHHIQKLRGEFDNRSSIAVELGADCYAGMWMRDEQLHGRLAKDDVAGALAEAAAVGDDRLCPTCRREQWTHGSSAMRTAAVTAGLSGGACDAWRSQR